MNTVNIRISYLKAALITAAKKDIRYYLNGVLVDILPRAVRIVSTDGHRCTVFHSAIHDDDADQEPAQIIIPRDIVKGIKGATGRIVLTALTYDAANPLAPCTLVGIAGGDRIFTPVDGKFPDYTRIMPNSAPSGERGCFNPHYLADFAEVVQIAADRNIAYPEVWDNGDSCAPVTYSGLPEFYGALMPMRGTGGAWELPEWLAPRAELKAAA
jgi:DNA polymerase-3 subunit beta